jgi:DNA-binding response OmpR family regulator
MKILAASAEPGFDQFFNKVDCESDLVETGEEVFQLLETQCYEGFVTDATLHDIDVWGLIRLIRSGKWCDPDIPIVLVDDDCEYLSSLLAVDYSVSIQKADDELNLLFQFKEIPFIKPTVLIIEDDMIATKAASLALKKDYVVELASTGKVGIEKFIERRHDLILLDLMLPDKSGINVLKEILEISPKQAVIISSARTETEMRKTLIMQGACEFLGKPYGPEQLRKACRIVHTQTLLNCEIDVRETALNHIADKLSVINNYMENEAYTEAHRVIKSMLAMIPNKVSDEETIYSLMSRL